MIDDQFLEILRCPKAMEASEGKDVSPFEVVHDCWLVSPDSGYKYPIIDGFPVLLLEWGERFKDVAVEDLPVPPPEKLD